MKYVVDLGRDYMDLGKCQMTGRRFHEFGFLWIVDQEQKESDYNIDKIYIKYVFSALTLR